MQEAFAASTLPQVLPLSVMPPAPRSKTAFWKLAEIPPTLTGFGLLKVTVVVAVVPMTTLPKL